MPRRTENRSYDGWNDAGVQSVLRRHTRDGCEGDALWKDYDRACESS